MPLATSQPQPLEGQGTEQASALLTGPERTDFQEYTRYPEMMAYLQSLQRTSPEMRLGIYGETREGRQLPFAVFSRPAVTRAWEAWALGKPIVVLAASVHGNERTLRESLLLMVRDLARSGSDLNGYLDDLVILVVPQVNPDGFEASYQGRRGNLWEIDLNRDYIKLEHPTIQSFVENILLAWQPHLFVDGHNGGSYPYNLNYQCTSHPDPDSRIAALCDEEIFPAMDEALEAQGFRSWYYQRGNANRWDVGGSEARIGRNYGGFMNSVGILFESPSWQEMQEGVESGVVGYQSVLAYAREHAAPLQELVRDIRVETIVLGESSQGELALEVEYAPEPYSVNYLIGEGEGDDRRMLEVQSDSLMKRPIAVASRPRPWGYIVPRDAEAAVELLKRHAIQVEVLTDTATIQVEAYVPRSFHFEEAYNHQASVAVEVERLDRVERTFPPGSYLVRTGQMMGRVAAHMLEPDTPDNLIYWNTMDAWLPWAHLEEFQEGETTDPPYLPIFRIPSVTPLPTLLLEGRE